MYQLRPYQQTAVEATLNHFRRHPEPAVIVLPTGAGKSLVIAELARLARGRVLVLAHVQELVEQNHAKLESLGVEAGIYSAGLKRRDFSEKVIFASVQSLAANLEQFSHADGKPFSGGEDAPFTLLVIDECHRVGAQKESQYQQVLSHFRALNPQLKVLGLTATPYRLNEGWIYRYHARGQLRSDEPRVFERCIYELPLRQMVQEGYLTAPVRIDAPVAFYDFGTLLQEPGGFSEAALNRVVQQAGRVTPQIVAQIQELAAERAGVMIFAATVAHAREILHLLPTAEAALVVADTDARERESLIRRFKARALKYLVNVSVLTTGFDAPHVDLIAILRPTESVSLYQQMIGRGLRLCEGKSDCLIIDYAGNPWDLYAPEVGSARPASDTEPVAVACPLCGFSNSFWGRVDGNGHLIEHFGRKCQGAAETAHGIEPCPYRFRFKSCPQCNEENDIAARQCGSCGHLLVDPDRQLRDALNLKGARVLRCAGMLLERFTKSDGAERLKVRYFDEDGTELSELFAFEHSAQRRAFYLHFVRQHDRRPGTPIRVESIDDVLAQQARFRYPDFVIGQQRKGRGKHRGYWQLTHKLFDYQGRFRTADAAGPE